MKTNVLLAAVVSASLIFLSTAFAEDQNPPEPQEDSHGSREAQAGGNGTSAEMTGEQADQSASEPEKDQNDIREIPSQKNAASAKTEEQGQKEEGVTPGTQEQGQGDKGGVKTERLPDRRWILKFKDKKGKIPKKEPAEVKWESEEQEQRCQSHVSRLKVLFQQTRYYSVHGDACNTAKYAKEFMEQSESCKNDCPEDFMKNKGYTRQVVRNVDVLYELAQKRCLESVR
jgi:hypothetical protein